MPRRADRRGGVGLRLTMFLIFVGLFTTAGVVAGIVYPYAVAFGSDDRQRSEEAMEYVLNETTDQWKPRALTGGLVGCGASSLFLLLRKPAARR